MIFKLTIVFLISILGIGIFFLFLSPAREPIVSIPTPTPVVQPSVTIIPSASPSPVVLLSPSPKVSPKPIVNSKVSNKTYSMNVLVIKYFPLTSDGKNIDKNITGDIDGSYESIKQHTTSVTNNLKDAMEKASSSLKYTIIDTKEYTKAVPIKPRGERVTYPDYNKIMADNSICDYVNQKGVNEVWVWAYQGPNKDNGQPFLGIDESKMSGSFGDISNSYKYNDMPVCNSTYRVYTFNYGRGTAEAFESWGHQLEAELSAVDQPLFREKFQGANYPQTLNVVGRCGSVHNPPNARTEYDRNNTSPQNSDCLDWNPDNLGKLTSISCQNWGCEYKGDNDNPNLNYQIWMWQNLPGIGNTKTYQGKQLRNWWDLHGDFDNVMKNSRRLTLD